MNLPLEKQVCSLDLAKRLKELGVKQESAFWWIKNSRNGGEYELRRNALTLDALTLEGPTYSAFTVAELGEMSPHGISSVHAITSWLVYKSAGFDLGPTVIPDTKANTEADARAAMLIYLIENNLLKVDEPK